MGACLAFLCPSRDASLEALEARLVALEARMAVFDEVEDQVVEVAKHVEHLEQLYIRGADVFGAPGFSGFG